MNSVKGGWLVFNKRDCFHWLLCAQYLNLPPELVYHIAKHMFYNFEPWRCLSTVRTLSCSQSRVADHVFWDQSPITIWNAKPWCGITICAREMVSYALFKRNLNVYVVDSNRRRSDNNAIAVYQECNFPNDSRLLFTFANSEEVKTENSGCYFRSVTYKYSLIRPVSVDILILLVRDDEHIDKLEQYIANVKHKQLVVLGNGENSAWIRDLCQRHWLDVIQ